MNCFSCKMKIEGFFLYRAIFAFLKNSFEKILCSCCQVTCFQDIPRNVLNQCSPSLWGKLFCGAFYFVHHEYFAYFLIAKHSTLQMCIYMTKCHDKFIMVIFVYFRV